MKVLIVFRGGVIERVEGPPGVPVVHRTLVLDTPSFGIQGYSWLEHAKKWLAEPEPAKPMDLCGWSMFELGTTAGFKRACDSDKTWTREDGRGPEYGRWRAWLEDSRIVVHKELPAEDKRTAEGGPDDAYDIYMATPQAFIRWAEDTP